MLILWTICLILVVAGVFVPERIEYAPGHEPVAVPLLEILDEPASDVGGGVHRPKVMQGTGGFAGSAA